MEANININRTTDYSIFNVLPGNRPVTTARKNKILRSIKDNGYIFSPITVNENMEVVDGQGRLAALTELEMPVDYMIVPGLGVKACTTINSSMTNWTLMNYIDSYAAEGRPQYIELRDLIRQFRQIPPYVVLAACSGMWSYGGWASEPIARGEFTFRVKKEAVVDTIRYLMRFTDVLGVIKGRKASFYGAILFAIRCEGVDQERLCRKVHEFANSMDNCSNIQISLREIERVYNAGLRARKLYLVTEYDKVMSKRDNVLSATTAAIRVEEGAAA